MELNTLSGRVEAYFRTTRALGIWGVQASLTSSFRRQATHLLDDLKEEEDPSGLQPRPDQSQSPPSHVWPRDPAREGACSRGLSPAGPQVFGGAPGKRGGEAGGRVGSKAQTG